MRGLALAGLALVALVSTAFGAVETLTDADFDEKVSSE
jgi:hypothetical protein